MQRFGVDDLFLHQKVTELHGVDRCDAAVGVVRSVDRENDGYLSNLWVWPAGEGAPRQLTRSGVDNTPRWSPSGERIAFVSSRGGNGLRLYTIRPDGGEASCCGDATAGVSAHRWLPDGNSLLMTLRLEVDPDVRGRREAAMGPRRPARPEVAWRLPYKQDGSGYVLDREFHLFHVDPARGERRQITDGAFDVQGFDTSPDGQRIAYVRHRKGRFGHRSDLWLCDIDGRHHRQLTRGLATVMQPAWSSDGRRIAFIGAEKEGDAQSRVYLFDTHDDSLAAVLPDRLEVAPLEDAVQWFENGRRLLVARAHAGCHQLVAVDPEGGEGGSIEILVGGDRQFGAFARIRERLFYAVESPVLPSEVFMASTVAAEPESQRSRLNSWWDERAALEATKRTFQVPDGDGGSESIEGWLIRAKGSSGPQPLLNDVHGGPAAFALLDFDTNVFWQVLCSQGWTVRALNPVGSASYGQDFCARLSGRWGELDLPQHLEAIRQLQDEGVTDDRIAISGKSYGGYLSAWATGHADLFRAAVVMAPVGNIETHYGTSDGGYYADPLYLNSAPTFDRERARALSPLQHIAVSRTPTLFLQGKEDERCPKCQAEEMFVTLCRAGDTPTEMVLYPGESHLFLGEGKPDGRADAAERIVAWLHDHVCSAAGTPAAPARQEPAPRHPRAREGGGK